MRKVTRITETRGDTSFSKRTVTGAQLDARVKAFKERLLTAVQYPFVRMDTMVVKVRQEAAVRSMSVLMAVGISENRDARDWGFSVVQGKSCDSWSALPVPLKARGWSVVTDRYSGLVRAMAQSFPSAVAGAPDAERAGTWSEAFEACDGRGPRPLVQPPESGGGVGPSLEVSEAITPYEQGGAADADAAGRVA